MMNRTAFCFVIALTVVAAGGIRLSAQGMRTQAEMHNRVVGLYSFSPRTLSKEQQTAKSQEMDKFWDEVKKNPDLGLPLLRHELKDRTNPAFFFEDGSMLLLSLSQSMEDETLVLEAISNADLRDVDPGAYFHTVHDLSMKGLDTTRAALHILDDPGFEVSVPMHAMTLPQGMALVYLLIPVQQERWMSSVLVRLQGEKDENAQKSLMMLLFYSQSAEGDKAIEAAAADRMRSEAVRKDAEEWLKDEQKALKAKYDVKGDERQIREQRKKRMVAVSDEAIGDIMEMTGRIVQIRKGKR